jgi:hypothetical protein
MHNVQTLVAAVGQASQFLSTPAQRHYAEQSVHNDGQGATFDAASDANDYQPLAHQLIADVPMGSQPEVKPGGMDM